MQFTAAQLDYFKAESGAFSAVTDREIYDSQITLTDHEQALTTEFFGEDGIHIGNVRSSQGAAAKPFTLHPSGLQIELNLVYPKPTRPDELRLYLRTALFKPRAGSIWYIFVRAGQLWLGQMDKAIWDAKFNGDNSQFYSSLDDDTSSEAQSVLLNGAQTEADVPDLIERKQKCFKRSTALVRRVLEERGPICEVYPRYPTFTSRQTGHPFVEAHHFIPMGLQSRFSTSLDIAANICILNPITHRLLHSGIRDEIAPALKTLLAAREDLINQLELSVEDIENIYLVG